MSGKIVGLHATQLSSVPSINAVSSRVDWLLCRASEPASLLCAKHGPLWQHAQPTVCIPTEAWQLFHKLGLPLVHTQCQSLKERQSLEYKVGHVGTHCAIGIEAANTRTNDGATGSCGVAANHVDGTGSGKVNSSGVEPR